MDLSATLTNVKKQVFDEMRRQFFSNVVYIRFLKTSEGEREFDEVIKLYDSWFLKYDKFRQRFVLEVAKNEQVFNSEVITATHVEVGEDIYIISDGDTLKPQGTSVAWQFVCERDFRASQFQKLY